jgi:hypothetical protein
MTSPSPAGTTKGSGMAMAGVSHRPAALARASTGTGARYGPAVANQQVSDQWRRIIGGVLVVLALALLPSIVGAANQHRYGERGADCGSWADPSELARYRPATNTAGCAQAIGDASRTIGLRAAAGVVLMVAGLSLLITTRVTRWIWAVALVALTGVIYAEAQPGGLATPITTFFYGVLVLVVVLGLMRSRSRRARERAATA